MRTITRKIEFDAGHRVLGHEGKCKHIHGHRYVCELTVEALSELDSLGRVVDFSVLKTIVGGWVDIHWDHNILLHKSDPLVMIHKNSPYVVFGGKTPYLMEESNPTAENIAKELFQVSTRLLEPLKNELKVVHVRVYETPNCWADYSLGE